MKLSKCHLFAKEIQYLGHVLSSTVIKPLPSKAAAIMLMNHPKTLNKYEHFWDLLAITTSSSRIFLVEQSY